MARPLKEIDENLVYELAKIHCTIPEIAACCKCSQETLRIRFGDVINQGKEEGKSSLRRAQMKAALNGNVAMLIWLGKSILGQTEVRPEDIKQIKEILVKIDPLRLSEPKTVEAEVA